MGLRNSFVVIRTAQISDIVAIFVVAPAYVASAPIVEGPDVLPGPVSRKEGNKMTEHRAQFEAAGYFRIAQRVAVDTAEAIQQAITMLFSGIREGVRADAWQYSGYIRALATAPALAAAAADVLGTRALRVYRTETYAMSPELPYHAAGMWLDSMEPAARTCCVWTALEDMTPDNGPLVVFPGTHTGGLVSMRESCGGVGDAFLTEYHKVVARQMTLRTPTYLYLRRGESCVLHPYLIHGMARRRTPGATLRCHRTWLATADAAVYYVPLASDMPAGALQRVDLHGALGCSVERKD